MKPHPFVPGAVYNDWTLLKEGQSDKAHRKVLAKCSCGTIKKINLASVRAGQSRSCGSCRRSMASRKHGHWRSTEYNIWSHMKQRCHNPKNGSYYKYGGRGIGVCERWRESFEAFLEDVGKRPSMAHTLDRFPNNDGDYEPGNVRWATIDQQASNKRPDIWRRIVCLLAGDAADDVVQMVADKKQAEEISRHIAAVYKPAEAA